jgi:hypothetical protein
MTCNCDITQQKIDAIEAFLNTEGWAFVHRAGVIILVKSTRDECRHKDTDKTGWCMNDSCTSGCDCWEGKL